MVNQIMTMTTKVEKLEDIVQVSEALGQSTEVRTQVDPATLVRYAYTLMASSIGFMMAK